MTMELRADTAVSRNEVASFLSGYSIETVPGDPDAVAAATGSLKQGAHIYIACVHGEDMRRVVTRSGELGKAGFRPVPHIAARGLAGRDQLDDLLARLRGEADVDRALLIGGDIDAHAAGAFASSREMLETGLFARHGFKAVGFATYPEPHPRIDEAVLRSELKAKLRTAADQGLESWIVSQFCFGPDVIVRHAGRLRADGVEAPLHVGVAGPASWKGIARFALICGVANSARSLSTQAARFGRLLMGFEPSEILMHVGTVAMRQPELGLAKPHFFSFGGTQRTASWVNSFAAGLAPAPRPLRPETGARREQGGF